MAEQSAGARINELIDEVHKYHSRLNALLIAVGDADSALLVALAALKDDPDVAEKMLRETHEQIHKLAQEQEAQNSDVPWNAEPPDVRSDDR